MDTHDRPKIDRDDKQKRLGSYQRANVFATSTVNCDYERKRELLLTIKNAYSIWKQHSSPLATAFRFQPGWLCSADDLLFLKKREEEE